MRRAIPQPIDSSLRCDVVDLSTREADIHQLPVAQVLQGDSQALALALRLERTPTSLEQAQDALRRCCRWSSNILFQCNGEVEAESCGIALGLGRDVRLLGWHRMLPLSVSAGSVAKQKAPSDAGGGWWKDVVVES